jgi:sarcosine oxidase
LSSKAGAQHWDAIVVGCGAMGASASYNLARRGLRVLTLERFGLNHELGSSHGKTRIIRLAYYEDSRYVPMLRRAFDSWRELETKSARTLLQMTGGLMVGKPDGELVAGVLGSAKAHGIPHRVLTASEAEEEFEAFSLDEDMCAVHENSAGILFPEECIRAFVDGANGAGCEVRFEEVVNRWTSSESGIEVESSKGKYQTDRLVLCAGAWNSTLLANLLPLQVERQVPFWFSSKGLPCFTPQEMPVFIFEEDQGRFYYGIPEVGHGVKVARTHGGDSGDPDNIRREVTEVDLAPVRGFISRRLRRLEGPPIASTTCLYTNTPDLNFVLGLHPDDPRVTIVSACSGHGFKFASVVGEVVADFATEKKTAFDVSFLGVERFARRSSP